MRHRESLSIRKSSTVTVLSRFVPSWATNIFRSAIYFISHTTYSLLGRWNVSKVNVLSIAVCTMSCILMFVRISPLHCLTTLTQGHCTAFQPHKSGLSLKFSRAIIGFVSGGVIKLKGLWGGRRKTN